MAAEIQLPDGNVAKVPEFALEATQQKMHDLLKTMVKGNADAKKAYEELVDSTKDAAKNDKKAQEEQKRASAELQKALKTNVGFRQGFADRIEADVQSVFSSAFGALGKLGAAAVGVAGTLITFAKTAINAYTEIGQQMNALTETGLVFNDRFGGSVSGVIGSLRGYGLSVEQTIKIMAEYSRMTAVVTKARLPALTREFAKATGSGRDLGMTMADAVAAMGDQVSSMSRMYDISNMTSDQLAASAARQISMQQKYASALGLSVDYLRKQAEDTIKNNIDVQALIASLGPEAAKSMQAFTTAFTGMGGESAEGLMNAIIEGVASPFEGLSGDLAQNILSIDSLLNGLGKEGIGPLVLQMRKAAQAGTLTEAQSEAYARRILSIVSDLDSGNNKLSDAQRQQLQTQLKFIAQQGDAGKSFVLSIQNAKQGIKVGAKGIVDPLAAQAKAIEDLMNKLTAAFDGIKLDLLQRFTPFLTGSMEGLLKIMPNITRAIESVLDGFFGITGTLSGPDVSGKIKDTITEFGPKIEMLGKWIGDTLRNIKEWLGQFITTTEDGSMKIDWGGMFADLSAKLISAAVQAIPTIIGAAFETVINHPSVALAIAGAFGVLLGAAAIKSAVVAGVASMFSGKAAAGGIGSVADLFKDKNGGQLRGAARTARAGALARGSVPNIPSATGGGLQGMAAGFQAFKNPMLIVYAGIAGAAVAAFIAAVSVGVTAGIWMISKAMPSFAEGLKSFNDVNGENLEKVGIGLAAFAAALMLQGIGGIVGVIGSIGSAISSLIDSQSGKKSILDQFIEFAQNPALSNPDEIGKKAEAFRQFAVAMSQVPKVSMFESVIKIEPIIEGLSQVDEMTLSPNWDANVKAMQTFTEALSKMPVLGFFDRTINIDSIMFAMNRFSQLQISNPQQFITNLDLLNRFGSVLKQLHDAAFNGSTDIGSSLQAVADALDDLEDVDINPAAFFNNIGTIKGEPIKLAADSITYLTNALAGYANLEVDKIRAVTSAMTEVTSATRTQIGVMRQVTDIDAPSIADAAKAMMMYNAAAMGDVTIPKELQSTLDKSISIGGDLMTKIKSFFTGGDAAKPGETTTVPRESYPQQMARSLSSIDTSLIEIKRGISEINQKTE